MALHPETDELIQRVLPMFQDMHGKGMLAPLGAFMDQAGSIKLHALANEGGAEISVAEAISKIEAKFTELALSAEIQASAIFYHTPGIDPQSEEFQLLPGENESNCHCIAVLLEHRSGDSVYLLVPHSLTAERIEYQTGKLISKPSKVF